MLPLVYGHLSCSSHNSHQALKGQALILTVLGLALLLPEREYDAFMLDLTQEERTP
jgi:hypothetical protein